MKQSVSVGTLDRVRSILRTLAQRQAQAVTVAGLFDSGTGGLSVLPSLIEPEQWFAVHYQGDTAHFPYGEKDTPTLVTLVLDNLEFLLSQGCSVVGVACNTASIVWRSLVEQLPARYQQLAEATVFDIIATTIGTIDPALPHSRIGLIGTRYTVHSGVYQQALMSRFPEIKLEIRSSVQQLLVNAIERGEQQMIDQDLRLIGDYFCPFQPELFILGCTHFGHIVSEMRSVLPAMTTIVDPSISLGKSVRRRLEEIALGAEGVGEHHRLDDHDRHHSPPHHKTPPGYTPHRHHASAHYTPHLTFTGATPANSVYCACGVSHPIGPAAA